MIFYPKHLEELTEPIRYLKEKIKNISTGIILINGEMGAGKTTFIRNFVQSFNPELIVNSPTYNLIHEYKVSESITFYHFDLYRIKTSEDVENLGFDEIWGKQGISLIEWGEIALEYYPYISFKISIVSIDENEREINIIDG
jgi:tRNA threonylcarbamoyladenosine biosynthesis protein TsaE